MLKKINLHLIVLWGGVGRGEGYIVQQKLLGMNNEIAENHQAWARHATSSATLCNIATK
jgi:hypothetical protein